MFFFFNDTATTEIYTLSLHDALPISGVDLDLEGDAELPAIAEHRLMRARDARRSEEHTSELQSPDHLVCRLLLEKKKKKHNLTCYKQSAKTRKPEIHVFHTTQIQEQH